MLLTGSGPRRGGAHLSAGVAGTLRRAVWWWQQPSASRLTAALAGTSVGRGVGTVGATVVLVLTYGAGAAVWAVAGQLLVAAAAGLVVGRVVDRVGVRAAATCGLAATAAGAVTLVLSPTTAGAVVALAAGGVGGPWVRTVGKTSMWALSETRSRLLLGMVGNMAGWSVGAALVGVLVGSSWWVPGLLSTTAAGVLVAWRPLRRHAAGAGRVAVSGPVRFSPTRHVMVSAALLAAGGSVLRAQGTYALEWFGPVWAGPVEWAHVAGQVGAALVAVRYRASLWVWWLLLVGALWFAPVLGVVTVAGRAVSSVAAHSVQAEVEATLLTSSGNATGQVGQLSAATAVLGAATLAGVPLLVGWAGWWGLMGVGAAATPAVWWAERLLREAPDGCSR